MTKAISYAAVIVLAAVFVVAGAIGGILAAVFGSDPPAEASTEALADIPPEYLALYQRSAKLCPGLDWTVLAAVGKIESDHGRSPLPGVRSGHNGVHGPAEGAMGPMQFMPRTWKDVRSKHPELGPNVYRPENAIPGAAHYLCSNGARHGRDLERAIWQYNHADWYVRDVLHQAREYREAEPPRTGSTDWNPQQATIPDPTSNGKITPRMSSLLRDIQVYGPSGDSITCVAERPQNPDSDHPKGRGCDIMFDPDDKQAVADGWTLAKRLAANQRMSGVKYIIWQGEFWSAENPQWVTYTSDAYGCPNKINVTGCHYDHVHVSVY